MRMTLHGFNENQTVLFGKTYIQGKGSHYQKAILVLAFEKKGE